MPLDAGAQDLIHRPIPPVVGEYLDLGIAGIALRLYCGADRAGVDDAVAHHAAVVENVLGRHQPVAAREGKKTVAPGARDLGHKFGVPPEVRDVERAAQLPGSTGIEPVADVERLS